MLRGRFRANDPRASGGRITAGKVLDSEIFGELEKKAAEMCDLFSIQGLTDEEIAQGIMQWCKKEEFVGTASSPQQLEDMELTVGADFRGNEKGVPPKHFAFDGQEAWTELAGEEAGEFNANKFVATLIIDPVLRLLQVYLAYNLLGQECCITKVTLTELNFIWEAYRHEAMNLGFWTAYQIHQISDNRTRHYSMCHVLGAFLTRNMQLITSPSARTWDTVKS